MCVFFFLLLLFLLVNLSIDTSPWKNIDTYICRQNGELDIVNFCDRRIFVLFFFSFFWFGIPNPLVYEASTQGRKDEMKPKEIKNKQSKENLQFYANLNGCLTVIHQANVSYKKEEKQPNIINTLCGHWKWHKYYRNFHYVCLLL